MTRYVKGHPWSLELLIVSMTICLCQNYIESIGDDIYDKFEQEFVSVTVYEGRQTFFLRFFLTCP